MLLTKNTCAKIASFGSFLGSWILASVPALYLITCAHSQFLNLGIFLLYWPLHLQCKIFASDEGGEDGCPGSRDLHQRTGYLFADDPANGRCNFGLKASKELLIAAAAGRAMGLLPALLLQLVARHAASAVLDLLRAGWGPRRPRRGWARIGTPGAVCAPCSCEPWR